MRQATYGLIADPSRKCTGAAGERRSREDGRNSFESTAPLTPGAVVRYEIGFPANDHVFRAGHRIIVQVQSTWIPVIDRNPRTFAPNIFLAKASDFRDGRPWEEDDGVLVHSLLTLANCYLPCGAAMTPPAQGRAIT